MTMIDVGGACLEHAQRVARRPIVALPHAASSSPVLLARRTPGDLQLQEITLGWARTTKAHIRGVMQHWEQCRTARPFSFTVPGDSSPTTVIYPGPPRFSLTNDLWGELTVELVEVDTAEF